jgi:hypothetical protein
MLADKVVAGNIGLALVVQVLSYLASYLASYLMVENFYSSLNNLHVNLSCVTISLCELLFVRTSRIPNLEIFNEALNEVFGHKNMQ